MIRSGSSFPLIRSVTAFMSCGPSSGLHSTTQLSLPSSSALTASSVPSTEMIFTSRPGWMPAASSASTAPSAMSSLWE